MTDRTAARLLCEKMTAGPWGVNTKDEQGECVRAFLPGHTKSGTHIATCDLYYEDTIKPEDQANAAGIVLAVSLLRALCDGGVVEKVSRVLAVRAWPLASPGEQAAWADSHWEDYEADAQSLINSIFDAAGREG